MTLMLDTYIDGYLDTYGSPGGPVVAQQLYNPSAVKVGPGVLYFAEIGSPEPTSGSSAYDVTWTPLGYTDAGHTFTAEYQTGDIDVAETLDPIFVGDTGRTFTIAFSLAQTTARSLTLAHGGGTSVSSTGYVVWNPPVLGGRRSFMLAWDALDNSERILWRNCAMTGSIAIPRQKAPNKTLIPVSARALVPANANLAPFTHWFNLATQAG